MKVRLAPDAARDLDEIDAYTRTEWGDAQAEAYADALDDRLQALVRDPQLGTELKPQRPGVYRFKAGRHFVIYRVEDGTIAVLRVLHTRSDYLRQLT